MNSLESIVGTLTVGELASRSGRTIGEIVSFAVEGASPTRSSNASRKREVVVVERPVAKSKRNGVNTRTPDGRAEYDEDLFNALEESADWMGAGALRKRVGGSPLQARTALTRLVESNRIEFRGRARSTMYRAR